MRKILFLILTVGFIQISQAQEEADFGFSEGSIFVEGGIMYNSEKEGNQTTSSFGIAPVAGYFFTDNVAAGLGLAYESAKVDMGGSSASADIFAFSAFGRYYFTPASRFSVYGELNAGYATADAGGFKVNTVSVGILPAVSFFLNENFLISGKLGGLEYSSTKADVSGAEATTNFGFELLLGKIQFGIAYKF